RFALRNAKDDVAVRRLREQENRMPDGIGQGDPRLPLGSQQSNVAHLAVELDDLALVFLGGIDRAEPEFVGDFAREGRREVGLAAPRLGVLFFLRIAALGFFIFLLVLAAVLGDLLDLAAEPAFDGRLHEPARGAGAAATAKQQHAGDADKQQGIALLGRLLNAVFLGLHRLLLGRFLFVFLLFILLDHKGLLALGAVHFLARRNRVPCRQFRATICTSN